LREVTIPATVTKFGNFSFASCNSLYSVTLEPGLKSIGHYSFSSSGVRELVIPSSIESMGVGAFWSSSLRNVTILPGLKYIPNQCFSRCSYLNTVTIPSTVEVIGASAFYYCYNLESVDISPGVKEIQEKAFYYCYDLENLTIPDTVVSIGTDAFYYNKGLIILTIPESVKTIGRYAFQDCRNLILVKYFGTTNPGDSSVFENCNSLNLRCLTAGYSNSSFCGFHDFCKGNISQCEDLLYKENHCFEPYCVDGNATLKRRRNATEWERLATQCLVHECINETGPFSAYICAASNLRHESGISVLLTFMFVVMFKVFSH